MQKKSLHSQLRLDARLTSGYLVVIIDELWSHVPRYSTRFLASRCWFHILRFHVALHHMRGSRGETQFISFGIPSLPPHHPPWKNFLESRMCHFIDPGFYLIYLAYVCHFKINSDPLCNYSHRKWRGRTCSLITCRWMNPQHKTFLIA